jgi:hypothetical protein
LGCFVIGNVVLCGVQLAYGYDSWIKFAVMIHMGIQVCTVVFVHSDMDVIAFSRVSERCISGLCS